LYFSQLVVENVPEVYFVRARTTFVAPKTCDYRFALSARGKAWLKIDGDMAISLWEDHPPKTDDTPCFNTLSAERYAVVHVEEGRSYDLEILLTNTPPQGPPSAGGVRLGGKEVRDDDETIKAAVKLAKEVDIPIIVTGMNSDFEYEASDRKHLLLPKRENELIQRVCEANSNTVSTEYILLEGVGRSKADQDRLSSFKRECLFKCHGWKRSPRCFRPGWAARKRDTLLPTFYLVM
jgi:beta-glucosidase